MKCVGHGVRRQVFFVKGVSRQTPRCLHGEWGYGESATLIVDRAPDTCLWVNAGVLWSILGWGREDIGAIQVELTKFEL